MFLAIKIMAAMAAAGAAAACVYYAIVLWAGMRFLRPARKRSDNPDAFRPPVSVLKPLKGIDPGMYESLRSHCLQDYPEYEVVFGVSSRDDPAFGLAERLRAEFAERRIEVHVCERVLGSNSKVSNLAQMVAASHYDYFVVNDSDIRVPQDYLRSVLAPMADPETGMVTCLYRGVGGRTLGARLEALGISSDFAAGVLVAREFEGLTFGLGSTLAFPRTALDQIGGFAAILDYLADDFELGNRISRIGKKVVLSSTVVEDHLPAYSLKEFWKHQLRWARTIRASRPVGYLGLAVTYGIPWAALACALSGGAAWAWALLGVTLALRGSTAWLIGGKVLGDARTGKDLWLLPIRDAVALAVWLASFAGNRVSWRGEIYTLEEGKLRPAANR